MSAKKNKHVSFSQTKESKKRTVKHCAEKIEILFSQLTSQIEEMEQGKKKSWHMSADAYEKALSKYSSAIDEIFFKAYEVLDDENRTKSDDDFIDDGPVESPVHSTSEEEAESSFSENEDEDEEDEDEDEEEGQEVSEDDSEEVYQGAEEDRTSDDEDKGVWEDSDSE